MWYFIKGNFDHTIWNAWRIKKIMDFPVLKHRRIQTKFKTLESILIYCSCLCGDDGLKTVVCEQCEEWYHYRCINKETIEENAPWYCTSATHNYSKTFFNFINSKCFVVVVFLTVSFLCFYPSLSKGFTYIYCVLRHTAILINFSLIFVIVSLVFSEACLCFTFNLFIVYRAFYAY